MQDDVPGMDQPERDGVRAHAVGAPLLRDGLGEPDDGRLSSGVVRLPDVPVKARRGGDVHDRAVLACLGL